MEMTLELPEQTLEAVAQRAAALVESRLEQNRRDVPRWVYKRRAAEFLGFSLSKVEHLTAQNRMPHHHHDGRIHYRTDELDAWLSAR